MKYSESLESPLEFLGTGDLFKSFEISLKSPEACDESAMSIDDYSNATERMMD